MTGEEKNKTGKRRLASAYTWLVLGWGALGLAVALLRGKTLTLIAGIMPEIGVVFSFIALLYSIFGIAVCSGLRRRFILPFVLSAPPVAAFGFVLLGLFMPLGPPFSHVPRSSNCRHEMHALQLALRDFRLTYDKYPTGTPEQIVAALQGANPRKIMFLDWLQVPKDRGNAPIDPWGTAYRIEVNETNVRVSSAGPDRRFGTLDDRATDELPYHAPDGTARKLAAPQR